MDIQNVSAGVQAFSAAVIVVLTVWLAKTATNALKTSQDQATAAEKTVAEMRKDRHLAAVPVLAITPQPLASPEPNIVRGALRFANASLTPALGVRVRLSEALGPGYPPFRLVNRDAGAITVIPPGATGVEMPLDFSKFSQAGAARLEKPWVLIEVLYRGILGARVVQQWYWEWLDWSPEPMPGLGEKLILNSMKGASGADGDVRDIELDRRSQEWPEIWEWPAGFF